nr:retrovirus-related Pol polyprotein from transposon TNT 1-94 [Tanacetum cinerariifolium]
MAVRFNRDYSQNLDEIERLKTRLKSEFEMKDLGEAKMILGMKIVRKLRKLCLTQKQYLRRVLNRFRFDKKTKRVSIPLASQFKISVAMSPKNYAKRAYMEKVPYVNAVGSLMYAMICTRPNISHVVGMVSRYMHNPGKGHWQAVKWILRYIHNTVDVGLVFEHGSSQWVEGYCDSDYAGDLDKRRSTICYIFTLAKAPVS